jgi:hypothetical protein
MRFVLLLYASLPLMNFHLLFLEHEVLRVFLQERQSFLCSSDAVGSSWLFSTASCPSQPESRASPFSYRVLGHAADGGGGL